MIGIYLTTANEAEVRRALGDLESKTPQVLKNAANSTARKARKLLAAEAQKTYAVKNPGFNEAMKIAKQASVSDPTAIIRTKGRPLALAGFKTSPATPRNGANRPDTYKAKVMTQHSLKPLQKGKTKAFIVKFASGHRAVVERTNKMMAYRNKRGKNRGKQTRQALVEKFSPSIPKMIGNEKQVYGAKKDEIYNILQSEIQKQIQKTIAKAARA